MKKEGTKAKTTTKVSVTTTVRKSQTGRPPR